MPLQFLFLSQCIDSKLTHRKRKENERKKSNQEKCSKHLHFPFQGLPLSGFRLVGFVVLALLVKSTAAIAQSLPINGPRADETLGEERSVVIELDELNSVIQGGARRDANLFHSFENFSVSTGGSTVFLIPNAEISNIFSRVTGSEVSLIDGVLGAIEASSGGISSADFYLMNPNGVIFGPSSRLSLGGNLVVTTADALKFEEQGLFSTQTPDVSPLLTINPSAFLFNRSQIGSITLASQDLTLPRQENEVLEDGKDLVLVGGDINIQNNILVAAAGGGVTMGGLADPGEVELVAAPGNNKIVFDDTAALADVSWSGSILLLTGDGDINIRAQNVSVDDASTIASFLSTLPEFNNSQGGDVNINANERISVDNRSIVFGGILGDEASDLRINSGNVNLTGQSIGINNASFVAAISLGPGESGNLTIQATDEVRVEGGSALGSPGLSTGEISTNPLARVFVSSGSAGDTLIQAPRILVNQAGIFSTNQAQSGAAAGDIFINASDTLTLQEGGLVVSATGSQGDAGDIEIYAENLVSVEGRNSRGTPSSIASSVMPMEEGAASRVGGDIKITTGAEGALRLRDGFIQSNVQSGSIGEGGDILIRTHDVLLLNGAQVQSSLIEAQDGLAGGQGRAGNVTIEASGSFTTSGKGASRDVPEVPNGVFTSTGRGAVGDAGDIVVIADQVNLRETDFSSETLNTGNAGELTIRAREIVIADTGISSRTLGEGNGGDLNIVADQLEVIEDSFISASAGAPGFSGKLGDGGNINVTVTGLLVLSGNGGQGLAGSNGLATQTAGFGDAGDITVSAQQLLIKEGAAIATTAFDSGSEGGDAGDITVNTTERIDLVGEGIFGDNGISTSALLTDTRGAGDAGRIRVITPTLRLREGGAITSATTGQGNAADVEVIAADIEIRGTSETGNRSRIFAGTGPEAGGQGGVIRVETQRLLLEDEGRISASSLSTEVAGDIFVNASDRVSIKKGEIATAAASANGGTIEINSAGILLLEDGDINAESVGNGGNIELNSPVIAFGDSDIIARSQGANGGNITIESLFSTTLPPDGQAPFADDNNVDVNADGELSPGEIIIPDTRFLQNDLVKLSESLIDPDSVVAASCVARDSQGNSQLVTIQVDGLANRPGDTATDYTIGPVSAVGSETVLAPDTTRPDTTEPDSTALNITEPDITEPDITEPDITEPDIIYRSEDGQMLLTQSCF